MADGKARGLPFYFDTWFSHTDHLSDLAYRAYHRMIGFMWEHGDNQSEILDKPSVLARATRLNGNALEDALTEIMDPDGPLLKRRGNKLISKRLRQEHDKYKSRSEAGRKSAKARWEKCERNANAMRTHNFVNAAEAEANSPCPSHSNDLETDLGLGQKYLKANSIEPKVGERSRVGVNVDLICMETGDVSFKAPKWRERIAYIIEQPGGEGEIDRALSDIKQPGVNNRAAVMTTKLMALEAEFKKQRESSG